MAARLLANGLRALFFVLGSAMVAILIYTISIDGLPFRLELLTPWMAATLVDYYINVVPLAIWVCYKESNWISSVIWIILLVSLGSVTTSFYIVIKLLKLSPEEALQDPMYHVLLHHSNKGSPKEKETQSSVVILRIVFSVLALVMLGTLIYTLVTDGSPFRKELLTPWVTATLVDFYINIVAFSVWVAYKESKWIYAVLWIVLFICFGSIFTCLYVVKELFRLTPKDPLYLVLVKHDDRAESRYERPPG